jgi:hypothetical protein
MTRFSFCTALAALTVFAASPNADARTHHRHVAHDRAATLAGAHNSARDDMSIRQKCYEETKNRWSSSNQDVQTSRDFAYRTCTVDHGVNNP